MNEMNETLISVIVGLIFLIIGIVISSDRFHRWENTEQAEYVGCAL